MGVRSMGSERREILSAEVFLDSFGTKVDTADIDAELERVNQELQAYRCDAGMEDYALAALCGILTGAVDAFLIKQTEITKESVTAVPGQLLDCMQRQADGKKPKTNVAIPHATIKKGVVGTIPQIAGIAGHATTVGLVATLLGQLSDSGMMRYDGEKLHMLPDGVSRSDGIWIAGTAAIAATMKWLYSATDRDPMPTGSLKTLGKLRQVMHASPMMADIVKAVDKWQRHLSGDIKGWQDKKHEAMGIDVMFFSLLNALAASPALKGTRLAVVVEKYRKAEKTGITAPPLAQALTQQAVPVLLNEALVRAAYFITRLAREFAAHEDVNDIEWENVMPFGNRTIERMVAIASMSFTVADVTDALFHAALDSRGDYTLFGAAFVKRVNVVGIGRAAVAVYRDVSADREEVALLEERRLLMEARTERIAAQLEAYRQQLEERVCEYIAEDISAFLTGFEFMDRGLVTGDSDLVIKGNVVIQRVLGRKPQFTNQQEFDDLMDSDIALKL